MPEAVFVSDFDGTITANDFYKLVAENLLPPDALTPWQDYRAGKLTHFEALQLIFGRIRAPEERLVELARRMEPDPDLARSVARLRAAGWEVVAASAGCDWYIRRILAEAGVDIQVFSNPGEYLPGGPLRMTAPVTSPFYSAETGVDKAGIVRFHQRSGKTAFAGDGFADLPAALLVPPALRFARADLADALTERGEAFQPFSVWSQAAEALLGQGGSA